MEVKKQQTAATREITQYDKQIAQIEAAILVKRAERHALLQNCRVSSGI
jgi:hypothetical protein